MDTYNNGGQFSQVGNISENGNFGDTTLRLNCLGFGRSNPDKYCCARANIQAGLAYSPDDGCRLALGLGPFPAICCGDLDNGRDNMHKQMFIAEQQGLSYESESILCLGLSEGSNDRSCGHDNPILAKIDVDGAPYIVRQVSSKNNFNFIPVVDEGSTSAKKSGGYMQPLLFAPTMNEAKISQQNGEKKTSKKTDLRTWSANPKKCKFMGCAKGARGASGLCISHGGGQRCQKPGCNKSAESRTPYCKGHGGGKRCQHLGCTKGAEGKTELCIAHGGGRRCGFERGCSKAARGKSGLCIKHGGGKRCKAEGCTRSAEGHAGLCISHGGGRRCESDGCSKGAQGSTVYCKAHGGGKRCMFWGCNKGAEGSTSLCKGHGGGKRCLFDGGGTCPKSVHGGTNFCVAHGGGKRCAVPGCTKSVRGHTDCCVKHGGGKRCHFQGCGKSAQGSTEFCKAHGGGKRCSWGQGKCDKFARGRNGLCAAHSSLTLVREPNKRPGLSGGLVSAASIGSLDDYESLSAVSVISDPIDSAEKQPFKHGQLPSNILVPPSMKTSTSCSSLLSSEKTEDARNVNGTGSLCGKKGFEFVAPVGGNLRNATDGL